MESTQKEIGKKKPILGKILWGPQMKLHHTLGIVSYINQSFSLLLKSELCFLKEKKNYHQPISNTTPFTEPLLLFPIQYNVSLPSIILYLNSGTYFIILILESFVNLSPTRFEWKSSWLFWQTGPELRFGKLPQVQHLRKHSLSGINSALPWEERVSASLNFAPCASLTSF